MTAQRSLRQFTSSLGYAASQRTPPKNVLPLPPTPLYPAAYTAPTYPPSLFFLPKKLVYLSIHFPAWDRVGFFVLVLVFYISMGIWESVLNNFWFQFFAVRCSSFLYNNHKYLFEVHRMKHAHKPRQQDYALTR